MSSTPSKAEIRRWRAYLGDERATVAALRHLAARREGDERTILLELAGAEERHAAHWVEMLGEHAHPAPRATLRQRMLEVLARRFGSVFVLALLQRAEAHTPYHEEVDAPLVMAADETIHEEVLRGLAAHGRNRLSGNFRAAVFGANDGLVSNLALIVGMSATGVSNGVVLAAGMAGLLAGALSMGAGEFISVRSARELLAASQPGTQAKDAVEHLDLDHNELMLVYRSRGMDEEAARSRAAQVLHDVRAGGVVPSDAVPAIDSEVDEHEAVGNAWGAAISSFLFFATGAVIPVLPYLFGLGGLTALVLATVLVGIALLLTGGVVGLLSGASPMRRGVRQLLIGYGAATVTYLLGLLFGVAAG